MAACFQVNNILNRLMSMYRGEVGFIDSGHASYFTWSEFSEFCNNWNNAKYFTWG